MSIVSYKDNVAAYNNYRQYCLDHQPELPSVLMGYLNFLGAGLTDIKWGVIDKTIEVPNEEVAQKIRLLAGPHWYAVLKIWEARCSKTNIMNSGHEKQP